MMRKDVENENDYKLIYRIKIKQKFHLRKR